MYECRLHSIRLLRCMSTLWSVYSMKITLDSHHIFSTEELSTLMKLEHLISRVSKKSSWCLPVSDQHGLNPVKVIYGIKWGCFLLSIWHMIVEKQSFVVSWLNLSFQGDPKGLLKSWWFGIMRFAVVAYPQRLHSNACLPSQVWKILLMKWKTKSTHGF